MDNDQSMKLFKLCQIYPNNKIINVLKLIIYKWDINDTIKYYDNDKFCHLYCICENDKQYGCKNGELCKYEHNINLNDLLVGIESEKDYILGKVLCEYLIYLNKYNNNAQLFNCYADVLDKTGNNKLDYILSEKYYLKSLNIDNNFGNAHNNYGLLLQEKLNNFEKAEYHYKKALQLNPNHAIWNYNFGLFLSYKREKYSEGIIYLEKACKLDDKHTWAFYEKGGILYKHLKKYNESIISFEKSLQLHNISNKWKLKEYQIKNVKLWINEMKQSLKSQKESFSSKTRCTDTNNKNLPIINVC